jgi:acyl-CoA thioester hydrolase
MAIPELIKALLRNGAMPSPAYLETFRTVIRQDDCDALGHMNVQHYFRAVSEGMFVMMARLGLGLEEIARRQLSFAVVRTEADFRRELHVGDVIALDSTITRIDDKLVVFHHQLRTGPGDDVAMEVDYKCSAAQPGATTRGSRSRRHPKRRHFRIPEPRDWLGVPVPHHFHNTHCRRHKRPEL